MISSAKQTGTGAIITILLLILAASCSPLKYIEKNEVVVEKIKIEGFNNNQDILEDEAYSLIRQKPNREFLGLFKPYLSFYNLMNVKNGGYKDSLKSDVGEPPAILDTAITQLSAEAIGIYLQKKGYFNAQSSYSIDSLAPQKVLVTYTVQPNKPFNINNYQTSIPDTSIRRIVLNSETLVDTGIHYDEYLLSRERDRITSLLKNNGYAEFENIYVRYLADSTLASQQVNLTLRIDNPNNREKHPVYTFNNTTITINATDKNKKAEADTVHFKNQYDFIDYEGKYRAGIFNGVTFLNKNSLYSEEDRILTYTRLGDLGVFKFINIDFKKNPADSSKLDSYISLSPSKRQSITLEGEMTLIGENLGGTGGITYTNRNLFRGGEQFDLSFRGGEENNLRQFEANARISFPKIFLPFNFTLGRYGLPRTNFSANFLDQFQVGDYRLRNYNFSIGYNWKETPSKTHEVTPIQIGVLRSTISDNFVNRLIQQGNAERLAELLPFFSLGSKYTYVNGANKLLDGGNFLYFKGSIETVGNSLNLVHHTFGGKKDTMGRYMVAGLVYPQYIRPEFDIRYYRKTSPKSQWVLRINAGFAYTYGNNKVLPYQKSFFVGGANSVRAWRTRSIGPGNFNYYDKPGNDTANLENFLRVGQSKLEANIEYRFRLMDDFFFAKLDGATFIDAGNVWDLRTDNEDQKFKVDQFYKQLAIGAGFGLRFDIDFLVFRIDLAAKIHDPQFSNGNQWVIKHWGDKEFKAKYHYNFLNLTLGIGYPF